MWCCKRKIFGIALASLGLGMLIVILLPWWGFVAAGLIAVLGIFLIVC